MRLALDLGFAADRLVWSGEKPRRGIPAKARSARYRLLADYAGHVGASHLVTAHTMDDQAETVLMRLVRGSGITGLGGMRRSTPLHGLVLERPLLGVPKVDLVELCNAEGWPFIVDATNADLAYARGRWRAAAPMLAKEGLTADRLDRLAGRLARADLALEILAAEASNKVALDGPGRRLDFALLAAMPDEIVLRVIRRALSETSPAADMRLERLEVLCGDLVAAHRVRKTLVRTLAGCVLSLGKHGHLAFSTEPQRRRGSAKSLQHIGGIIEAGRPVGSASLGKGTPASYIGSVDAPAREPDVVATHSASGASRRGPMLSAGPQ